MKPMRFRLLLLALTIGSAAAQSFYTDAGLFSMRPDESRSSYNLTRFGPVGISLELIQPAFTMKVGNIEDGSPAAAAGLKPGQIIESINGEKLQDIDPRIQLGNLITAAEASDGILTFAIKGEAAPVVVKLPVFGAYSPTWPLNCPKSDKIVRNFADYLKKPESDKGFAGIGMLFLLSTGEESDLAVVRDWARSYKGGGSMSWHIGYALTFTVPRKTLRLTGAPRTKFSKTYQLPERPWGTAEDDDFESIAASTPAEFDPAKPGDPNRALVPKLEFQANGTTDNPLFIWSGNTLMNLHRNEALAMCIESHNGTEYLFVESGGFQTQNGNQWKSPWFVLKRF